MSVQEGIAASQPQLPGSFRDLEPFVDWALPTEKQRIAAREAGSIEEMQVFYDAMMARLPAIVEHLKQFPLDRMPADSQRLLEMALSLIEVSIAVELYRQPHVINGFDRVRFAVD
ncbi:MAG TPA: hypothetical protein VMV15_05185 [Candidatus Binataceae bacterium]|nr:hypothetical protein [Candidatus Binataceae bacterium]